MEFLHFHTKRPTPNERHYIDFQNIWDFFCSDQSVVTDLQTKLKASKNHQALLIALMQNLTLNDFLLLRLCVVITR
jgi:hypothetical protein